LFENYADFRERIQYEFNPQLQLAGRDFEIYRFNFGVVDISERQKISFDNFNSLKTEIKEPTTSAPLPLLYVWSITDSSTPSPDQKDFEDGKSISTGRSISNSIICKMGAIWTCLACGYVFGEGNRRMLEAAHILEVQERADYSEAEFAALLQSCGIVLLEDVTNLISLCRVCHNDYFDQQLMAITVDPAGKYSWIVKEAARRKPLPFDKARTYEDVHNKEIRFIYDHLKPPINLVLHRLQRFNDGIM